MFLGLSDRFDLGCDHRESGQRNTVEFVEATPETGLANTLEDLGHISELVLIRAVGDDDENTEGTSQILDGFGLSGTGGSSGCTTEHHTESLGKGNVTSISELSDAKTFLSTEEFIRVNEFDISDRDGNGSLFNLPVATGVLKPIEIVFILKFVSLD